MPVATSRRKKTARQASSDIEEDQATQGARARRDEVDDEDEDAPPRQVKKEKAVKKEKGKAQARQEDPDDDDDDEDDRIDISNFAAQPLAKSDCAKILGLAKDWDSVEKVMHQPSPIIEGLASAMAEVDGEEAQEVCFATMFVIFTEFHAGPCRVGPCHEESFRCPVVNDWTQ
jgi:hypothetical protein